jgi:hypothetical protein
MGATGLFFEKPFHGSPRCFGSSPVALNNPKSKQKKRKSYDFLFMGATGLEPVTLSL